jgi:hypothetical protein
VTETPKRTSRGPVSAADVVEERSRRTREDPEFRAQVERQEAEAEARAQRNRAAERAIVDELRLIGIDVESVWDLYKVADSRPRAIPVLLKHITMDYPDGVLMGIGQGLDDKSARAWWSELRAIVLGPQRAVVRDRVACALATCAARENYDDLVAFAHNAALGESRIYFLRPINRIGNRISPGQGRAAIQTVVDDSVLGKEATAILRGRSRNE